MNHCVDKILAIVEQGQDDRRSVWQLGYNLGRLSELTGLGREPFWDGWKDAVVSWDLDKLRQLAQNLPIIISPPNHLIEERSGPPHPANEVE